MKVYLSGGMHSGWQSRFIERHPSVEFIDPSSHNLADPKEYTKWDMRAIKECDFVIAYLEKDNPSGLGLAFEIGYAVGLNKPVVLVNEKGDDKYTAILEHASTFSVVDIEEVLEKLSTVYA